MNLCKYGIEEEQSDIRAHVSLPGRCITVFRTADMVKLIKENKFREVGATQPGVEYDTAKGRLVPLKAIKPKGVLTSEVFPWGEYHHEEMDTGAKGDMAVECVIRAIRANKFPLWLNPEIEGNKDLDIQGTDVIVSAKRRIQVKYDHLAYPKAKGGSGNLFIQTHESNPRKIYGDVSEGSISGRALP